MMQFVRGFVYWGIFVVVLSAIAFVFWKFFLCTRTGYESRKTEMRFGVASMVLLFAAFLFIPIMMTEMDGVMVKLAEHIQDKVRVSADSEFRANARNLLDSAADELIAEDASAKRKNANPEMTKEELKQKIDERQNSDAKKTAVENAAKYASNKTFREMIETFVKLYNANFDDSSDEKLSVTSDKINRLAYKAIEPIGKKSRKNTFTIPSMDILFGKVLDASPLSSISGVRGADEGEKIAKAIKSVLAKTFIILTSIVAFGLAILIFLIIIFIKEPKAAVDDADERMWLFEFDRLDKTTGKKISEKLNQYN